MQLRFLCLWIRGFETCSLAFDAKEEKDDDEIQMKAEVDTQPPQQVESMSNEFKAYIVVNTNMCI